jgi:hypothetical protein
VQLFFYLSIFVFLLVNSTTGAVKMLTPATGATAWPFMSDYAQATYGNFSYQIVLQNLNSTQAQKLQSVIFSPYFVGAVSKAFQSPAYNSVGVLASAAVYNADPVPVRSSSFRMMSPVAFLPLLLAFVFVNSHLISQ